MNRQRLLIVDVEREELIDSEPDAFAERIDPGDLVIVNDAATLPASVRMTDSAGVTHEWRLVEAPIDRRARAVVFGSGDHRMRTEDRPTPRAFLVGETLAFDRIRARVESISALSPRLATLAFDASDDDVVAAILRSGAPVQYSYVPEPLPLYAVQTIVAARPWAVEMPSAARPLRFETLLAIRRRGATLASLTHAAGLSATGDAELDRALPFPERYEIPRETVDAIAATHARGGRVIAVGTSVARALEDSASRFGTVESGRFVADLILDIDSRRRVVDGLLTGIHVEGESHYRLLRAFLDERTLVQATEHIERERYRIHEFGDACLVLCRRVNAHAHGVAA